MYHQILITCIKANVLQSVRRINILIQKLKGLKGACAQTCIKLHKSNVIDAVCTCKSDKLDEKMADDEVAALVIDNGSGMCKANFAGDVRLVQCFPPSLVVQDIRA